MGSRGTIKYRCTSRSLFCSFLEPSQLTTLPPSWSLLDVFQDLLFGILLCGLFTHIYNLTITRKCHYTLQNPPCYILNLIKNFSATRGPWDTARYPEIDLKGLPLTSDRPESQESNIADIFRIPLRLYFKIQTRETR